MKMVTEIEFLLEQCERSELLTIAHLLSYHHFIFEPLYVRAKRVSNTDLTLLEM